MTNLPVHHQRFNIQFPNGHSAQAIRVNPEDDPAEALKQLGIDYPHPVIFLSGGAGAMSDNDRRIVQDMILAIGEFAAEHKAIMIDGGTESGVMEMIGTVRQANHFDFPLIGVSPMGKVSYPGYKNPGEEATLEDTHTHFVLVDGDEWGSESMMIMHMAHTLCGDGQMPAVGVLVNGGRIALQEVFLATNSEYRLSIIVLEGSGRAADEISTAYRTGKSNQIILQAILKGGDIKLVGTVEGPAIMKKRLQEKFGRY